MNREKVEFPANIPTVVELDGIGTLQASKSGDDEYRYFLKQNRIMWVPPAVHEQITEQEGNTGDVFQICKHQAKARAPITWEASLQETTRDIHGGNGYSNAPVATTPPRPQRDLRDEAYGRTAAAYAQPQRHPTSQAPPPAPQRTAPQPAAQLAQDAPELAITAADRMGAALKDAIDLWRAAAAYAPELHYDAADVRALAATLFIGGQKEARS